MSENKKIPPGRIAPLPPLPKKVFESFYPPLQLSKMTREELKKKIAKQRAKIAALRKRLPDVKKRHAKMVKEVNKLATEANKKYKDYMKLPADKKTPIGIISMYEYTKNVGKTINEKRGRSYKELNKIERKIDRINFEINKMVKEILRRSA